MKKLIPILLLLVLILLTSQAAWADECPQGGDHEPGAISASQDASCTEGGYIIYICTKCGESYKTDTAPALGHSFTNYVPNNNATCTADGTKTAACDNGCGESKTVTDEGSVLGHSFTNYVSNGNATCTAEGTKTAKCDRCDVTDTKPEPALGHDWGSWEVTTEPTCTEAGELTRVCGRCELSETKPAAAFGHQLNKKAKVEPTCTDAGTKEYWVCSVCKKMFSDEAGTNEITKPEPIPAAGTAHKPGKAVKENEDIHCRRDSSYDEVVYCTLCKKELSRKHVTYKSSHDYQPWEWHQTITRKYYKCTKCGNFYWIHNQDTLNMMPGLVRYGNGEAVDYRASATGLDDDGTLTVTPIRHTSRDDTDDICLYMTPHDVYVWTWEKINKIRLVRGSTTLTIDPNEITPEIFGLTSKKNIDYYIFTLTPSGKDSWLVRAEALTDDDERIPAEELEGISLKIGDNRKIAIPENGVYEAG